MKFQYSGSERACRIIQRFWYPCLIACVLFFPARAWSINLSELQTLQFSGNPASVHNVGVIFGQQIYTPSDTQAAILLENDRPYAGFLYGGLVLHSMELFDVLRYDLISRAGLTLGNVRASTSAGGEIRFGSHIPQDSGSDVIRAGAGVSASVIEGSKSGITSPGAHVFVSFQVEAVLHDIFPDGNTWRDGPGVGKKPLVTDLSLGASFSISLFKLTYRHLFRTEQFEGRKEGRNIGSLTLAVSF